VTREILILGTGAMACLCAARLSLAGISVTMLGSWPEGLQALRENGVRLVESSQPPPPPSEEHFQGREQISPVRVVTRPGECAGVRYALVLVKSWQTGRVAKQLAECLPADGLALTLQNGLGNRETLMESLGSERVALGVTTSGATLLSAGRVRAVGSATVSLGEHLRLEPLVEALRIANFRVEVVADTESLLWGKLVVNSAINPLTALLRLPNGELLTRPAARSLMGEVAAETARVAAAQGIVLPYSDAVAAVEAVAQRTAENISSMLRDVQRDAPTEIEAINGAIVRAGEQVGVSTPLNRTLWQLVSSLRSL